MNLEAGFENRKLILKGSLTRKTISIVSKELAGSKNPPLEIDLSGLSFLDPAGAAYLDTLSESIGGRVLEEAGASMNKEVRKIWENFSGKNLPPLPVQEKTSFLYQLGGRIIYTLLSLRDFFVLTADTAHWSFTGLFRTKERRKGSVIQHCYSMGFEAIGIIGLLSLILGFILALQSAIQLRQYGAGILAANLLTLALIHEMAPIMTSIIVAGRTGSAVASEVATMEVTEELDALRMMSLNPVRFVLVPKMMAITLVMPLLLTLAIIMGIAGGLVVGIIYLDLTPQNWIQQSVSVIVLKDVIRSYAKTVVFAWVIVLIGAHFGFRVKGGSEGVGRATTQSVVASIFSILVLDALFSFTLLL